MYDCIFICTFITSIEIYIQYIDEKYITDDEIHNGIFMLLHSKIKYY